jgi:hypothetical protein
MGRTYPKPDTPLFQFGFTGWKQMQHDDQLDSLRYGFDLYTPRPRTSLVLANIQGA